VTEGIFGIRPIGLHSFQCQPRLPEKWNQMALRNVHGYGNLFDIEVTRGKQKHNLSVISQGKTVYNTKFEDGDILNISMPE
jgi:hypothetical protein